MKTEKSPTFWKQLTLFSEEDSVFFCSLLSNDKSNFIIFFELVQIVKRIESLWISWSLNELLKSKTQFEVRKVLTICKFDEFFLELLLTKEAHSHSCIYIWIFRVDTHRFHNEPVKVQWCFAYKIKSTVYIKLILHWMQRNAFSFFLFHFLIESVRMRILWNFKLVKSKRNLNCKSGRFVND